MALKRSPGHVAAVRCTARRARRAFGHVRPERTFEKLRAIDAIAMNDATRYANITRGRVGLPVSINAPRWAPIHVPRFLANVQQHSTHFRVPRSILTRRVRTRSYDKMDAAIRYGNADEIVNKRHTDASPTAARGNENIARRSPVLRSYVSDTRFHSTLTLKWVNKARTRGEHGSLYVRVNEHRELGSSLNFDT